MTKQEWIEKGDDYKKYPFCVLYTDRAIFPPSNYYATKEEAMDEFDCAGRAGQCVSERRFVKGEGMQAKLVAGQWPAYGTK